PEIADKNAKPIVDGIMERLQNLCDIGFSYMTLTRETPSLSGGESQRVKMVKYLSSNLTGLLYIFDEPSTGLHPRDVYRLTEFLVMVRGHGDTVLLVVHRTDVIALAVQSVHVGPQAGGAGGSILYAGSYEGLLTSDTSTENYLNRKAEFNYHPRDVSEFLDS